jgi:hypothetical protein
MTDKLENVKPYDVHRSQKYEVGLIYKGYIGRDNAQSWSRSRVILFITDRKTSKTVKRIGKGYSAGNWPPIEFMWKGKKTTVEKFLR